MSDIAPDRLALAPHQPQMAASMSRANASYPGNARRDIGILRASPRGLLLALLSISALLALSAALHAGDVYRGRDPRSAATQTFLRARFPALVFDPLPPQAMDAGKPSSPAAAPFILKAKTAAERARATQCLANAIYYEAALEPKDGQRAVAQVVLNRVRDPNFPHSVCGVVYQGWERLTGCQFSFVCDGSLSRTPLAGIMAQARSVAERALDGYVSAAVGTATHYHAASVDPWWRPTVVRVSQVGSHIFYRWPGEAGLPSAFNHPYTGDEARLPEAVIDGRQPRPWLDGPAQKAIELAAVGAAPGATGSLPPGETAVGGRVHMVAMMPGVRRQPTPDEVARINAALAKFSASVDEGKAAPSATTAGRDKPPASDSTG